MMRISRHGRRGLWLLVVAVTMVGAALGPSAASAAPTKKKSAPLRVIIDTDLSRWWDDATVMGIANVLQQRGVIKVLGIMSNVPNDKAVAAIDAIDTAYGHGDIPVGAVKGSEADTFQHGYSDAVAAALPHDIKSSADAPNAVDLYRRLLAKQPNHSVTIISIGGFTNIDGLLNSKRGQGSKLSGRDLIEKKVTRLVQQEGFFPTGGPPFTNQKIDLAAAADLVGSGRWPTPIAWVDGQPGIAAKVGAAICTTDDAKHPMRIVFDFLFHCGSAPGDGDWDAPTFLYGIGDIAEAFTELGQGGSAVINEKGGLTWQDATPTRPHDLYVHVDNQQNQDTLNNRIDELLLVKERAS